MGNQLELDKLPPLDRSTPIYKIFDLQDDDKLIDICNKIYTEEEPDIQSRKNNYWKKRYAENVSNDELAFFRKIMEDNGFTVKENYLTHNLIEVHMSNSTGKNRRVRPHFNWHVDDDGGISGKVNTLIVYLENTATQGGELEFVDENNKIQTIRTCKNRCVLIRGDVHHQPKTIYNGHRIAVVIQFPR